MQRKKMLGEILIESGLIDQEKLNQALKKQQESRGKKLGQILIETGFVTGTQMADALANQGHRRVNLLEQEPDWELVNQLDEDYMRKNLTVPFAKDGNVLQAVTADPTNYQALDSLRDIFRVERVEPNIGSIEEIEKTIDKVYSFSLDKEELLEDEIDTEEVGDDDLLSEDSPLVSFLNELLERGIRDGASDIHIEPQLDSTKIRFRVDGELIESGTIPKSWKDRAVSRLKIMADLDIAKKREPQDGEIRFKQGKSYVNMRVSTLPVINGEKVVIRILGQGATLIDIEQLGFSEENYRLIKNSLNKKQGMILVTGPTGSGKTTTLYACLERANSPSLNITTIEDPVEIRLPGINQTQINVRISFSSALRAILRQDPDIVMVGEIRDQETADIAVRASLTGHLLFSTLHTLDTIGVVTRLLDMGVESYLVADAIEIIVAQRLVRAICPKCRVEDPEGLGQAQEMYPDIFSDVEMLYAGTGCSFCHNMGYKGRLAVHETLKPDEDVCALISTGSMEALRKQGPTSASLFEDGLYKVAKGLTSFSELMDKLGYSIEGV